MPGIGFFSRVALVLSVVASVPLLPAAGMAQSTVFTRVNQSGGMGQGDVAFAYGVELKRSLADFKKSGGGGGGGGGLGGQGDYAGVNHQLSASAGVSDWLTLSYEQTIKQPQADTLELGVIAPELRLELTRLSAGLGAALPLQLSTFVQGRMRLNARRYSSVVVGAGADRQLGRLWLTARVGFETTLQSGRRENGLRYQLGASYALLSPLLLTLEAWGSLVWPDYAVFQQDHHAGPSLRLRWGRFFGGVNVALGTKERPGRVFVDIATMARLGGQY